VRLDLHFTPPPAGGHASEGTDGLAGARVAVVDVLRATTSIVLAAGAGCRCVIPVADLEEATELVESLGRSRLLLGGERDSRPIPGFDLGNSPAEYAAPRLAGATVVMLTTNGTAALARLRRHPAVAVAALVNLEAAARWLAGAAARAVVVCAGHAGRFCLEDAVCAGLLARRVLELRAGTEASLNDAARVGLDLAERWGGDLRACLETAEHGRGLAAMGLAGDLALCARRDLVDLLPFCRDGRITLAAPPAEAPAAAAAALDAAGLPVEAA